MVTATLTKLGHIARARDLADVVESYGIKLDGYPGKRVRQAICPLRDHDTDASFTVYGDSQRYFCFGCDARGDALDFIRTMDNLTLQEAINTLQQQPIMPKVTRKRLSRRTHTPKCDGAIVGTALDFYQETLMSATTGEPGRNYLKSRGISRNTAASLQLGYCTGTGLMAHLRGEGFDRDRIARSGLMLDRGKRERFSRMIVVPEILNGSPAWMTGRTVLEDVKPRFNALPGNKAILGIGTLPRRIKRLIVAEGVFDWLTLREWGLPSVALAGNGNIERLIRELNGVKAEEMILALDANEKGESLTRRLLGLEGAEDDQPREILVNASSVALPDGFEDIGDMATFPNGKTRFIQALG